MNSDASLQAIKRMLVPQRRNLSRRSAAKSLLRLGCVH